MTTVTLKEAATALGISESTARRWQKSGKLPATLEQTGYGPTWMVDAETLGAVQLVDVVKLERPVDPQTLALAVGRAVAEAVAPLVERMDRLEAALQTWRETFEREAESTEPVRSKLARPRWWQRLVWP